VDDHELLLDTLTGSAAATTTAATTAVVAESTGAGAATAPTLRRRDLSPNSFERTGEAGCVSHVWDTSFDEYISTVRPSALLLFPPTPPSEPTGTGTGTGTADAAAATLVPRMLSGEAHYALRVLGVPIFILSNELPPRLHSGTLYTFLLEAERVHAEPGELAAIVEAHARLVEEGAAVRAALALTPQQHSGAVAVVSPFTPEELGGGLDLRTNGRHVSGILHNLRVAAFLRDVLLAAAIMCEFTPSRVV
jgi:hypothetical protein